MNSILLLSLFLTLGSCVVLRLPLLNEDSKFFTVKRRYVRGQFNLIFYESINENDVIDKVYYHGVEIYPADLSVLGVGYNHELNVFISAILNQVQIDNFTELFTEEQRNNIRVHPNYQRKFRRLVVVGKISENVFICVVNVTWDGQQAIKKVDRFYKYDNDVVDVIMEAQDRYMRIKYEENIPNSSKIIRNILKRDPTKVKSYGELDEVDDDSQLGKGVDINEEQIEKEVEQVINKPGISEADLREAGPSGLSSMLRRKLKLNEISEDTDSY
ncbi:hypothetical protein TpMuguga_03g00636 [Theileria parva strain Muguga]|uniref:Uncharacterized protein n=1 Tax=Theileria parva TaxID=5875 RepID=Q4MZ55_THEPA|nr:uncharacterized protein TpMuguga_03g00636 [Theileria parva strain Muguga]EAN30477.1 hypothetical protein TpMuguga_03g00636 [Theileria parva strain Muguga]|eukprot:XP_762760.1 hypothetical protein [Theileria parva strain Muguga]